MCSRLYYTELIFEYCCSVFPQDMGMLEGDGSDETGEWVMKNVCPIIGSTETYFYDNILYLFIHKIEYHDDHLYFEK